MSFAYARDGMPYGFGWMSTNEMRRAIMKYLKHFAICESYTELQTHREDSFRVLFVRNHFICIIRCSDGLYYFDSLGPNHLRTILSYDPPHKNDIAYQQIDSATCGAFVCLIAAIYSTFENGKCTIAELQSKVDNLLCPDVIVNEFNIIVFVASQGIGEEFTSANRYLMTKRVVSFCSTLPQ
jgi:hypothetical protein